MTRVPRMWEYMIYSGPESTVLWQRVRLPATVAKPNKHYVNLKLIRFLDTPIPESNKVWYSAGKTIHCPKIDFLKDYWSNITKEDLPLKVLEYV